ncbi:MAG: sulfate permease [Polyangiaceae bacterium]|nr:sulfate permease [Polyangiaceae bacterium]
MTAQEQKLATPGAIQPKRDIPASIAVFFVAVPLCLGIAHASGAPILAGLVAGIIGGIVIGFLSPSHLSVSGPAAGLTAIVLAAKQGLGSYELVVTAVFVAGIIQLILGAAKAGFLASFFPSAVVRGMLAAIGVLLILKQFPHLVGYDFEEMGVLEFPITPEDLDERYGDEHPSGEVNTFTVLLHSLRLFKKGALIIGVVALAVLIAWEKLVQKKLPSIPGSVVAVVVGVGLDALFQSRFQAIALEKSHLVQIPAFGSFGDLTAALTLPKWSGLAEPKVYVYAVTIAVVASLESLLSVEALDKIDPERMTTPANKELLAQGAGNILSGLLGGLPITAVVVRSSVNLNAGGKSKLSAILHGVWLVVALIALRPIINRIPLSALAAVLVYTGAKLASPKAFREMLTHGYHQWLPYVVTIAAIVFTDLLKGVAVGFVISSIFILRNSYISTRFQLETFGRFKRLVLGREVTFLQKARLMATLEAIEPGHLVEIDGSGSRYIDPDIVDVIAEFREAAAHRNIQVIIAGIPRLKQYTPDFEKIMSDEYKKLLSNNQEWVKEKLASDADFFKKKGEGQAPQFMFIGCSDSRVPENTITQTEPGEIFVHRNIANLVSLTDINLLSVLQYSVEVLNVKHVIVCGHYGCGGVHAALQHTSFGLIDNWISQIKMIVKAHHDELVKIDDPEAYERRVVELHVIQQCRNLYKTSIVQNAVRKFGFPKVHGWVYDLHTGLIKDLGLELDIDRDFDDVFHFLPPPAK